MSKWNLKVHQACANELREFLLTLRLQVEDLDEGSTFTDRCDVLIQATGALNTWKWPTIPGLHDFKGKLMHSASWDESYHHKVCQLIALLCGLINQCSRTNASQ
jgi:hypothetical protein